VRRPFEFYWWIMPVVVIGLAIGCLTTALSSTRIGELMMGCFGLIVVALTLMGSLHDRNRKRARAIELLVALPLTVVLDWLSIYGAMRAAGPIEVIDLTPVWTSGIFLVLSIAGRFWVGPGWHAKRLRRRRE
jgi:hypothetical protein